MIEGWLNSALHKYIKTPATRARACYGLTATRARPHMAPREQGDADGPRRDLDRAEAGTMPSPPNHRRDLRASTPHHYAARQRIMALASIHATKGVRSI
jgi:hypothetical protein